MIKLLIPLCLLAIQLHASPRIELEWGPSPDQFSTNADWRVNNYRLYVGSSSSNYTSYRDLGVVTNAVYTNLVAGSRYFFVVTALNAKGAESDPSNELNFMMPIKPQPPGTLKVKQILQSAAAPVGPWSDIGTLESLVPATEPAQFFRVVLNVEPPPIP